MADELPGCTCISNLRNGTHRRTCPARVAHDTHRDALDEIHQILDGNEWHAATLEDVAAVITNTGRVIRPPHSHSEEQ